MGMEPTYERRTDWPEAREDDGPKRESQVEAELGQMDDAIAKLGMVVEEAEQRLRTVLRDEVAATALRSDEALLVPHAERIRTMRQRVEAITEKLSGVNNRIEV